MYSANIHKYQFTKGQCWLLIHYLRSLLFYTPAEERGRLQGGHLSEASEHMLLVGKLGLAYVQVWPL